MFFFLLFFFKEILRLNNSYFCGKEYIIIDICVIFPWTLLFATFAYYEMNVGSPIRALLDNHITVHLFLSSSC